MRNITKIRRSIRAISPVISILLMIAIAVVASIVAYAWVMGYLGFQTEKAGNQIQLQSWTSQGNLTIYVQNTGQGTVHLKQDSSVYVNDVLKNILQVDNQDVESKALIPITVGQTVKVEVDYQNFHAGDRVKVVTVEGTFIQTTGNSGSGGSSGGSGGSGGFGSGPFTITPMAEAGGTISPNTPQQVTAGGSISFTVTALQGYHIDNVYVDGSPVTLDGQSKYTFSNVQANHDIHAVFAGDAVQNRYTITVTQTPNGIINPGTSTYDEGATPSFTIKPADGYQIASITANGQTIQVTSPSGQTYKFNALTGAGTLTATYSAVGQQTQYTITPSAEAGGTITPNTPQQVTAGGSISFTVTALQGYHIDNVYVDGSPVTLDGQSKYTFSNVQANHDIHAVFAGDSVQNRYTITVTQTANGIINPGTSTYDVGATPSFTITPESGYQIASITANGQTIQVTSPSGQTYEFNALTGAGTLTATYSAVGQQTQYTITVTQTDNGIITPGTTTVNAGESQSFTIAPAKRLSYSVNNR